MIKLLGVVTLVVMEIVEHNKPCTRNNLEAEIIGNEIFLYDSASDNAVYRLNNGAAVIWILCDGSRNLDEITREITSGFQLDHEEVRAQVKTTIENFRQLNLLEPLEG